MKLGITMLAAALLLAACGNEDPVDPDWRRELAVVYPEMSSVQMISAPAEARIGVPFTVTVRSLDSSSCTRIAETKVVVSGLDVSITPYNEKARRAVACTDDLHPFVHQAQVTVGTAGTARIRLHAQSNAGQPLTYDLTVQVRPAVVSL